MVRFSDRISHTLAPLTSIYRQGHEYDPESNDLATMADVRVHQHPAPADGLDYVGWPCGAAYVKVPTMEGLLQLTRYFLGTGVVYVLFEPISCMNRTDTY